MLDEGFAVEQVVYDRRYRNRKKDKLNNLSFKPDVIQGNPNDSVNNCSEAANVLMNLLATNQQGKK
jgi:hypothetical protein